MRTEKVEHWIASVALLAGIICVATIIVGSAAYADPGQTMGAIPAGSVPMIDPFALKIIWVAEAPPASQGNDPLEPPDVDSGGTVRIPDRQTERSVFKPSP